MLRVRDASCDLGGLLRLLGVWGVILKLKSRNYGLKLEYPK